ncbi:hypothetical protein [Streptomyces sp. AN091965]|uniref:hypothetical protein n=1 Tax=Streptomyces sp. AN091965 TaxID=2927803 RepID=UPI001F6181FE|nr:hypothetical protein [Streptomyces sp. AN091965]MCI3930203.1 hypothetical protein [Streptomyces sp. AN091965]
MTITADLLCMSIDEPVPFTLTERAARVVKPSVDFVMDAPIQQLLDELHVELVESSITDPGYTGHAIVARGEVVVWLPPNRPEFERDCMTRYLIGDALRVDGLPPLPEQFKVTEFTNITGDVNDAIRAQADEALRRVREDGA